ncbi:hypothetical protein PGB90_000483 [Kerria lacca]
MPNIINEIKLDFKDVLLRPKRSTLKSRADVDLCRSITFRNSKRTYKGIPVIASNMDTVGTFEMAQVLGKHRLFTTIHKYYSVDEWKKFAEDNPDILDHVAVSSGSGDENFQHLQEILEAIPQVTFICLDVANGYSQHFVDYAGNVVTGEMIEELILSGADIVKVGIGPGSVCTTRIKTGVGYPQLSCVMECADAAHGLQGHIVSDGGCTCAGDVAKAFGAGADFVMIGGLFAGHDQCGGELMVKKDGTKVKLFYGMSSETAIASEGKTVEVPYRGDVNETILDILGGLRSACTYTGAAKLKELPKRATFIRCTQQVNSVYSAITVKE